jgi:uncharacterized membrane protein
MSATPFSKPTIPFRAAANRAADFGKKINWRLVWAWTLYLAWSIPMKLIFGVIYFALITQGFLNVYADTNQKLFKLPLPGFAALEDYEWTYHLRLAHFCAMVLLLLTWLSWSFLLQLYLTEDLTERFRGWNWNVKQVKVVVTVGAVLVIIGDAGLFYNALQYAAFGGAEFSAFTLIGSLVWVVMLVLVNFVSLFLSRCVKEARKKQEQQLCNSAK